MKISRLIALAAMMVTLAACATAVAPPPEQAAAAYESGFWWGLWNGTTIIVAWIGSLFDSNIAIYQVPNNGGWYDFGFVLGLMGVLGGAIKLFFRILGAVFG